MPFRKKIRGTDGENRRPVLPDTAYYGLYAFYNSRVELLESVVDCFKANHIYAIPDFDCNDELLLSQCFTSYIKDQRDYPDRFQELQGMLMRRSANVRMDEEREILIDTLELILQWEKQEAEKNPGHAEQTDEKEDEQVHGADQPEQSAPPTSPVMQVEREYSHKEETNPSKGHASERKRKVAEAPAQEDKSLDFDDDSLHALNPVRTLQFLLKELHSIVKPQRSREVHVFKMIEDVVSRIPGDLSPDGMKRGPLEVASDPNKQSRPEVSITNYERLRKDRDHLYKKLEEKNKSHLALERKLAASEAELARLSSELEELKDKNKQMVKDQKRILDSVAADQKHQGNHELEGRLENELAAAKTYIGGLEDSVETMRDNFSRKMRTIQDALNDALDHSVQENPRISDIIGLSPFDVEPLEYPNDSIQAPANLAPIGVAEQLSVSSSSATSINTQKFIDQVMKNSGLLKPEQEHLFQSFHSMADQE